MKNTIGVLLAFALLVSGCGKSDELENQNRALQKEMAARDKYIDDVTSTIGEIHDQLDHAWAMEKKVVKKTASVETRKPASHAELVHDIFARIFDIDSALAANRKRVSDLEGRINASGKKYAGLQKLVDELKRSLEEREKSIADLQLRVQGLQTQVQEKDRVIALQETTMDEYTKQINRQSTMLNTAYYVVGKKSDLKEKGIITDEGGFLWGLIGTTTVLSPNFKNGDFVELNKAMESSIDVPGTIDELLPRRDKATYAAEVAGDGHTILKILDPGHFWRDNRLVVIAR